MAQELGRVTKPEVKSLEQGRRLFLIPLIFSAKDVPPEYMERFDLYWKQVTEHIANLETKLGKVTRIYHESISLGGEDGLKIMENLNEKSCQIAKEKCQNGAELETAEDKEIAEECMDWERCLLLGFLSNNVARKVSEFYIETSKKRYEHISKKIDETLEADGIAILFIREGHMMQFPKDVEVFSVAPPALDEIHRWLRDHNPMKQAQDDNQSAM